MKLELEIPDNTVFLFLNLGINYENEITLHAYSLAEKALEDGNIITIKEVQND